MNLPQSLKDLEGFSHLWIVYGFHKNKAGHWKPLVHPPRGSDEVRGVFATRSPYRPNPIGLSIVELLRVNTLKGYLEVRGGDLLHGSPIYDIKPYLVEVDSVPSASKGWVQDLSTQEKIYEVLWSDACLDIFNKLEAEGHGGTILRRQIERQLDYEPLNSERKRVELLSEGPSLWRLSYLRWRVDFTIEVQIPLGKVYCISLVQTTS